MSRWVRSRTAQVSASHIPAWLGGVALLIMLPFSAAAEHRSHDEKEHARHGFWLHHDTYRQHPAQPVRYRRYFGSSAARHASHHDHQARFLCRPCGHRFDSRRALVRHVHHRHQVPAWFAPFFVVHHAMGWVFHG